MLVPGQHPSLLTQRSLGDDSGASGLSPSSEWYCLNGVTLIDKCTSCAAGKEIRVFTPTRLPPRAKSRD